GRRHGQVADPPVGDRVASSGPAGAQADGKPRRLAGTTGRISALVAAVPSGVAESQPCSNGGCVQVGVSSSGLSAMNVDHARAMPSRPIINCEYAAVSANGGTSLLKLLRKTFASAPIIGDNKANTDVKSPMIRRAQQLTASS